MAETSVSSTAATTPPPLPPWSEEIECILDNSLREMPIIGAKDYNPIQQEESANTSACALCCLLKGSKRVWNLSKKAKYDVGDYLLTPARDVHRVKYFEDTEFFNQVGREMGYLL
uniref:Uncharacterized protein n=1 Tax=Populus trichocarpa TaxID=3694 RepID=A0A2K1Y0K7_POPTR